MNLGQLGPRGGASRGRVLPIPPSDHKIWSIPPSDHFPLFNYYANAVESSEFGADRNNITWFVQIETDLSCEFGFGDGALAICLFARVIQQFGLRTRKP